MLVMVMVMVMGWRLRRTGCLGGRLRRRCDLMFWMLLMLLVVDIFIVAAVGRWTTYT
jgi:hypothetical protein